MAGTRKKMATALESQSLDQLFRSARSTHAFRPDPVADETLESRHLLLVREYAVGLESYHLGLPMGLVREEESAIAAANRELMEETGYASA
jgi:8-oxo-dGTP pyrophosphatase MutT (NUDIX family)